MNLNLLAHQWDALHSETKNTLLLGGVGSGKTFTGCCFVLKQIGEQPYATGLIGANTYQQLRDVSISALTEFFDELNIPYVYNKNEAIITVNGITKILCRSMENYDKWRGVEIGWYWLDEVAYSKKDSFDVVVGRLRDKKAKRLHGLLTTTPKGMNWLFDYFHENGELKTDEYSYIQVDSRKNKHLPAGYIESLYGQYDEKFAKQEIEGQFINIASGRIYYSFDRDKHIKKANKEESDVYPIWIGMDFNVDPMTAVVGYIKDDVLHIYDEFYEKDSNTRDVSTKILYKYGNQLTVIPDYTGKKRTTNASKSDIQILKSFSFNVESTGNPFRLDRYACVNTCFHNKKIVIDPKCKMLIKDLENVSYKVGSNDPDTKDKTLTHISDALGYLTYKTINPFNKKKAYTRYRTT